DPICVTSLHPRFELITQYSGLAVRKQISLAVSRIQCGYIAGFVAWRYSNDYDRIDRSSIDVVAEPSRGILIPSSSEDRDAVSQQGALGSGTSGSGPSIFILSPSEETAKNVKKAGEEVYGIIGLGVDSFISPISISGASIL